MSCLKHSYTIKEPSLFKQIYKSGKQYHRPSFVIFYMKDSGQGFGFVSSRKVGNAVQRNRSRRVLRSILNQFCDHIKSGYLLLVAKDTTNKIPHTQMVKDFERGLKYLGAYR